MSVFDDKTIKPKRSKFWLFAPIVGLIVAGMLWVNFASADEFSWTLFWIIVSVVAGLLIIWKLITYLNSSNHEVREYENEMKKRGRR